MDSQKIISELSSDGISVLKAGKEGKPDSLLHSVDNDGNVYSNPKYEATDDVSKALDIEVSSREIVEMNINKKDAEVMFGGVYGDINTGDVFKINGVRIKVLDKDAVNSLKMKVKYGYGDKKEIQSHSFDFSLDSKESVSVDEFGKKAEYNDGVQFGGVNNVKITIKGEEYTFDFGDLSKANIERDKELPEKPEAPKRKIGEALIRTLAGGKNKNR